MIRETAKAIGKRILYARGTRRVIRRSPLLSAALMRGVRFVDRERTNTGGTDNARYCYSVWLRHLVHARAAGLAANPGAVLELGPGDSIGVGLAAILCGASTYVGVDAQSYVDLARNLEIFEKLVELFSGRAAIPDAAEFPEVRPALDSYAFPHALLPQATLEAALHPTRLEAIRRALRGEADGGESGIRIESVAPWTDPDVVASESFDLVISQAVMEHVADLPMTYDSTFRWLRAGGAASHEIDLRCHGTAADWNGHWIYPEPVWRWLQNDKVYLWINRQPCSAHLSAMQRAGFELREVHGSDNPDGVASAQLAQQWSHLSHADLSCASLYVVAQKPASKG